MFDTVVPSRLIAPFVPGVAHRRFGAHIDKALTTADTIWAGKDETALSQRTALLVFTIRITSAFIAYLSQVLMARWLGTHEYGVFVWVWVAAVIAGGVACVGFPSAVVRFIPEYKMGAKDGLLRGIIFGSRLYSVAMATLIAALGIAATRAFGEHIPAVYLTPLVLGAICLPMLALAEVQDGVGRAYNWIDLALSPTFLVRPVLILAIMVGMLWAGYEPTAITALQATIAATWLASAGQLLLMNRRLAATNPAGPRLMAPKVWLKVALPIFLVEGFFALMTSVDILIAGYYLAPEKVAVYFAAVKTLALVHFVYYAVKAAAAHRYSQYFAAGDKFQYETFVRDTVKWTFWPSLAMGLVMLIAGKFLLSLFGPEFTAGYPLLFILVAGIVARSTIGPAESVLTMSGEQNACALVFGLTLLVNIVLNISFIPTFGLYGAACATTFAMVFEAVALYAVSLRRLGLKMFVFSAPPQSAPTVGV